MLDLAHGRTAATDTWTGVGLAARAERGHDGRGQEAGEAEPEKCGEGLGLDAALVVVVGAVDHAVAAGVGLWECTGSGQLCLSGRALPETMRVNIRRCYKYARPTGRTAPRRRRTRTASWRHPARAGGWGGR